MAYRRSPVETAAKREEWQDRRERSCCDSPGMKRRKGGGQIWGLCESKTWEGKGERRGRKGRRARLPGDGENGKGWDVQTEWGKRGAIAEGKYWSVLAILRSVHLRHRVYRVHNNSCCRGTIMNLSLISSHKCHYENSVDFSRIVTENVH